MTFKLKKAETAEPETNVAPAFPKTIGECADLLYRTRQSRLELARQVAEIEDFEKRLKEHIIDNLPKSKQEGAQGKVARVTIVRKPVPQVKDWDSFYKYVKKTGHFELMQKRLTDAAIMERLDAGVKLPGVKIFTAVSLSINKV